MVEILGLNPVALAGVTLEIDLGLRSGGCSIDDVDERGVLVCFDDEFLAYYRVGEGAGEST
ncbi:MAG: hypothetical protein HOW73_22595 [Polyangiaceae bacterium]|nr:hypothetical protein [Polyangiaceae bacterium]